MSENVKRSERKSFAVTADIKEKLNEMIAKSGKEAGDFFEDMVTRMSLDDLSEEAQRVSPDLQNHFNVDLSKLNNALNSIQLIFESQMRNIINEKDVWEKKTADLQATILNQVEQLKTSEARLQAEQESLQQTVEQNAVLQGELLHHEAELKEAAAKHQIELEELARSKEDVISALKGQLESEKKRLEELQGSLEGLVREYQDAKEKVQKADELQQQVNELQHDVNRSEQEKELEIERRLLFQEKQIRIEYQEELKQNREDIRNLTKTTERLRQERDDMKREYESQLLAQNKQYTDEISRLNDIIEQLKTEQTKKE